MATLSLVLYEFRYHFWSTHSISYSLLFRICFSYQCGISWHGPSTTHLLRNYNVITLTPYSGLCFSTNIHSTHTSFFPLLNYPFLPLLCFFLTNIGKRFLSTEAQFTKLCKKSSLPYQKPTTHSQVKQMCYRCVPLCHNCSLSHLDASRLSMTSEYASPKWNLILELWSTQYKV